MPFTEATCSMSEQWVADLTLPVTTASVGRSDHNLLDRAVSLLTHLRGSGRSARRGGHRRASTGGAPVGTV